MWWVASVVAAFAAGWLVGAAHKSDIELEARGEGYRRGVEAGLAVTRKTAQLWQLKFQGGPRDGLEMLVSLYDPFPGVAFGGGTYRLADWTTDGVRREAEYVWVDR